MIYGRTGDVVTIVRVGTIDDVRALDGRKPDKRDREAVRYGSYVVVRQDDGKERLYHQAYLRADNGSLEIGLAIAALKAAEVVTVICQRCEFEWDANKRAGDKPCPKCGCEGEVSEHTIRTPETAEEMSK